MKEAAGEANLTVVTIILIGIVVAVAIPLVSNLMRDARFRTCCNNVGGEWVGGEPANACTIPAGNSTGAADYAACIAE